MLTLTPGCACDVCAEEYGVHRLPHSIPCGHVLCSACCQTIVEKTSPRLAPACPFCRESFAANDPRPIRMDFATSGWSTPHRVPESFNDTFSSDLLKRKTAQLLTHNPNASDVRKLEMKVAKAATHKCR
ncbi:hypothetical protein D9619_010364 [Psilocybe cf. subviscida]|uniref:RING-type domain-containing protein n=1 Tax=Psilocybe cf. subviscida TaxID=2480587 RepID=A0A8H5AS43_9AGAR|nr:hypothetical protein D9619_010364 [Psilocybe cf. subviscida]